SSGSLFVSYRFDHLSKIASRCFAAHWTSLSISCVSGFSGYPLGTGLLVFTDVMAQFLAYNFIASLEMAQSKHVFAASLMLSFLTSAFASISHPEPSFGKITFTGAPFSFASIPG